MIRTQFALAFLVSLAVLTSGLLLSRETRLPESLGALSSAIRGSSA
jgi:hypothetical protein